MFDVTDSESFYGMLVEDFEEFLSEQHSARRALHCAISAYHLHEWMWADWLKHDKATQARLNVHDRNSFLSWICQHCIWFTWIRDLANGTKHSIRRLDFETHHVAATPLMPGPQGGGYLMIDNGERTEPHRYMPVANLLEVVVRFWRDFFKAYRPGCSVVHSQHHAL